MSAPQYKPGYNASWALLVGINNYIHASPLSYACNDVDAMHDALVDTLGFPAQNVLTLKDTNATKGKILDQFMNFHNQANHPDDRLLFFFAGHGFTKEGNRGQIGFLVPSDGDFKNLNSLIRWDDLTRNAELINAKHILFIIDACYSGLAFKRSVPPQGSQRFITDLLQRPARQVLTAGKEDQKVADGGGPQGQNSIFTGCLIEGIRGKACNDEGVLTASFLMSYVYENVGKNPRSEQTPHFGHLEGEGDFIFLTPGQEHITQGISTDYNLEMVAEQPEDEVLTDSASFKTSFATQIGYGSSKHPNFGRNDLTGKLGEMRNGQDFSEVEIERAFSWLGIVIEPLVNQPINIEIARKASNPNKIYVPGDDPYQKFTFPASQRTTAKSLLFHSEQEYRPYWERFLKIESSGTIEYGDSSNAFIEWRGHRFFRFVQIIGLTWQLLFLAKQLLHEAGYNSSVRLTFGLVGTQDTILSEFSKGKGKNNQIWPDPNVVPFGLSQIFKNTKCEDKNIKIEQDFVIGKLGYDESLKIVKSIGQNVDLAYNHHGSPRCFNPNSDLFPWDQYFHQLHS